MAVTPSLQFSGQPETDDFGDEHRDRLTEHGGFGFDPADAPGEHAQAVGHRRVRVGADDRVGIRQRRRFGGMPLTGAAGTEDDAREVLDVDLMDDAGVGRHRAVAVQRALSPLEEAVALDVAFELELGVAFEGVGGAERVDLHRVVDDDLDRLQRVDLRGLAAEIGHRVAHRRQIDHARDAGEVLQEHAGRPVGDLLVLGRARLPAGQGRHVVCGDRPAVLEPEQVLEQDLERKRQGREIVAFRAERVQAEIGIGSVTDA